MTLRGIDRRAALPLLAAALAVAPVVCPVVCPAASRGVVAAAPPLDPAVRQLVFVVTPGWEAPRGSLAAFERDAAGVWRRRGASHAVFIGRAGCGWGLGLHPPPGDGPRKREGDGRSPAGVFAIGPAFGAAATCDTGLEYRPMKADDWCIDVATSPHYNRIVSVRDVGEAAVADSTEPMRRDLHLGGDPSYALGFVIGHNCGCEPGAGSCIFAHLVGDPPGPTAGCTAMTGPQLTGLLEWLEADAQPRFVLLPAAEAAAKAAAWGLPAHPGAPP